MILLVLVFLPLLKCFAEENVTVPQDEYKCSLPDVTSIDDNLDITRFRSDFSKISEVKFPGLIGPLNERLICKIKCIDGNWVGPLCSTTADGRFQPILRECFYRDDYKLLSISFKNSSIEVISNCLPTSRNIISLAARDMLWFASTNTHLVTKIEKKETYFPHGSIVTSKCKHFGLYKLKGESQVRCENGEWSPKFPECVPTTLVTNFTGDAPPSIQYIIVSGSAVVEPSGELFVYPESTLWLDCIIPRVSGDPDWSWTQALGQHNAAWATDDGEKETHYRLTLTKMSARHSDQYTCTSSGGHTNTIIIKVVSVVCPPINVSSPRIRLFSQGWRLGHSVHFSCQPGYHLNGSAIVNCMGNGHWSALPPTCEETFCPMLRTLGPHLSLVEYNSSYGGRAVFQCSWGYRLVGVPGLECEFDGRWSGDIPHCIPIYCPNPIVPEKGRLLTQASTKNGKYAVGDLLIYGCDEGYHVLGEQSIVCTENGFWSHPPPFCLRPSEIRKADTIYIENTTLVHFED